MGYQSFEQKVYLSPGDTFELVHVMRPLANGEAQRGLPAPQRLPDEWTSPEAKTAPPVTDQPASPYGMLAIRVEPADVQVSVDGEAWAMSAAQAELVIHLPTGWHRLEIRKPGDQTFATEVELYEGQASRLGVKLVP